MFSTLTLLEVAPDSLTTEVIDLLTPEDPALAREMASFHVNAFLRHLLTLTAQGEASNAAWLTEVRTSVAALVEVLG